jgi:hypothetical protein
MNRTFVYAVFLVIFLGTCLTSCAWRPAGRDYDEFYAYLNSAPEGKNEISKSMLESEYFIVFLVDARHLDYSNSQCFLKTVTKHPSNGCKDCSVGHAWIYLKGVDGRGGQLIVEGGHSGELGVVKPSYFNGIMELVTQGDENPVRYLWENLEDGFFQKGNGGHPASYAACISLTKDQFWNILTYIDPKNYSYKDYSLTGRQCGSLVAQIAALVDIEMDIEVTMNIDREVCMGGQKIRVWTDERYSQITFPSPDAVERSLMQLVHEGKAEDVTDWYCSICGNKEQEGTCRKLIETIGRFPLRYLRHQSTVW